MLHLALILTLTLAPLILEDLAGIHKKQELLQQVPTTYEPSSICRLEHYCMSLELYLNIFIFLSVVTRGASCFDQQRAVAV